MAAGSPQRWQRVGLLGAVLVLLAYGGFNVFAVPPFTAGDETAHTDYALEVASGRLPTFDARYPDRIPGMSDEWPTMAAVHPPLYYLLVAVPLRMGVATGSPVAGLHAARLLTLALSVLTVVLVAHLAAALAPGRPRLVVAAAGLLATVTSFQQVSAFVYNDALAVCTVAFALLMIVRVLRAGVDRRRLVLLTLAAVLAAASRSSGLEVAALACLAAGAAAPLQEDPGRLTSLRERLLPALGRMAVVASAVGLATGWFYLRNVRLYGDPAGSARAIRDNPPGLSVIDNAGSPRFWLDQWGQLWGYVTGMDRPTGAAGVLATGLLITALLGLALVAVRTVRGMRHERARRGRVGPGDGADSGRAERLALAWLAMGAHAVLVTVTVLAYFSAGAIPFGRYFFPLLPLLPVLLALALAALPGGRSGIPTAAALLAAATVSVLMTGVVLEGVFVEPAGLSLAVRALALGGVPAPGLALAVLGGALLAGLALLVVSIARLPDAQATAARSHREAVERGATVASSPGQWQHRRDSART